MDDQTKVDLVKSANGVLKYGIIRTTASIFVIAAVCAIIKGGLSNESAD